MAYLGSVPTINNITPGLNQLTVDFSQTDTGNPPATYYYSLDGSTVLGDGISSSPLVITNVSGSVFVYIVASNSAGNVFSLMGLGFAFYMGSPIIINTITPGINQLTVDFTQDDTGSSSPDYYYSLDGTTVLGNSVSSSPLVITDISGETSFYIVASYDFGETYLQLSDISSGTPYYIGNKPTIDEITLTGDNQITVAFSQSDSGNPAATYYYSLDGTNLLGDGISSSPLVISDISQGTQFYIVALNTAGNIFSDSSSVPITQNDYIGTKPIISSVTSGTNQLTIDFYQDDSGNPLATYYYSLDGSTLLGDGIGSSPIVIPDISGETTFYIVASNTVGNIFSDSSSGTPYYLGSKPVITSVTPGTNQLTIDFYQDNSGNPAATYYYSLDGTNLLGDGVMSSPIVIPDLSGETTFYIVASNTVGNIFSDSSSGTPYYLGSTPVVTNIIPGLNQLTVEFTQNDVGNPAATYYYSLNGNQLLGTSVSASPLIIPTVNVPTTFYIAASNNLGNVFSLQATGTPNINIPCFGENTRILCFNPETYEEEYMLIKNIRRGTLVKTLKNGYVKVDMIGRTKMHNNYLRGERHKNRLYKCTKLNYPEMRNHEDLILTGCHSILVDGFKNEMERDKTIEVNRKIYITDNKYRLPACVDRRAEIYEKSGEFTIYHFALENADYYMNYGVYANGLLVETSSKRYMRELSNMELI